MTFVVTSSCEGCRFTDCVEVCPVDCFHGDMQMLYIDPESCIRCGACVPQCPVDAIFPEEAVPEGEAHWIAENRERSARLPVIYSKRPELQGAREKARRLGFVID